MNITRSNTTEKSEFFNCLIVLHEQGNRQAVVYLLVADELVASFRHRKTPSH
jgi:hypothetical protein